MHQSKRYTTLLIRPLDVIHYENGGTIEQGLVLATEPTIGAGKIITDNDGTIQRIGMLASIAADKILPVTYKLPIQTIEDALAMQYGFNDREGAREQILAALLHKEITIEL